MKKLFSIILLILSPVSFAETVNPDLLIGTWRCKSGGLVKQDVIVKWNDTVSFYKGGFYHRKSVNSYEIFADRVTNTENSIGEWDLKGNLLMTEKKDSLNFASNHPLIAKKYNMEQRLKEFNFLAFRQIEVLSNGKLMMTFPDKFKKENEILNDSNEICERIKENS